MAFPFKLRCPSSCHGTAFHIASPAPFAHLVIFSSIGLSFICCFRSAAIALVVVSDISFCALSPTSAINLSLPDVFRIHGGNSSVSAWYFFIVCICLCHALFTAHENLRVPLGHCLCFLGISLSSFTASIRSGHRAASLGGREAANSATVEKPEIPCAESSGSGLR